MKFIDFCAGIGGGRLGLENIGLKCIAFSEIDKKAEITYREMFNNHKETNFGNLMHINPNDLPNFDVLIGGFPCQTFSIIGDRCGLDDYDRGQVIYGIAKIIKEKNLKYFILENVKGLTNHDKGKTFKIILELLKGIGYKIEYKVLNSINFGVPQMRERIYIVGIRNDLVNPHNNFNFPNGLDYKYNIKDFLCDDDDLYIDEKSSIYETFLRYLDNKYNKDKYSLDELLKQEYLVIDTRQSDIRLYNDKVPTIRKGRQGILYIKNGRLKKLSGYESLLLQGFPKEYALKVKGKISNSNLLAQAGNAMTVNVISEISKELIKSIKGQLMTKEEMIELGSTTAKNGFKNEDFVVSEFNRWKTSSLSKGWLEAMNYNISEIETVRAEKVKGSYKADVQVEIKIEIKLKHLTDIQNLQVKLVSNPSGFNQIDKRWLKSYNKLWDIPNDVYNLLQHFTGELEPTIKNPKDNRRMFINEFSKTDQQKILKFFNENKTLIITDILKGRGKFAAEWMLVILNIKNSSEIKWILKPMNIVMNFFGNGNIEISPRGSIKIGKITIQRKGGDNGRDTANMLQFKINPTELFNIEE